MTWYELENSDTSSGHGTHCAGTVGGNGDASGGARRGVAPGVNLIGLSTGEALWILNAIGGLEWVYEHSKPGANPYNIRVVSNSWGSSEDYDPEDAVVQLIEKLTYENNVVVVEVFYDHDLLLGTRIGEQTVGLGPLRLYSRSMNRIGISRYE